MRWMKREERRCNAFQYLTFLGIDVFVENPKNWPNSSSREELMRMPKIKILLRFD